MMFQILNVKNSGSMQVKRVIPVYLVLVPFFIFFSNVSHSECYCGAERVDITPHLGLPMAGYSFSSKTSKGTRGRLWARIFLYQGLNESEPVGIVIMDSHSTSRLVVAEIAKKMQEQNVEIDSDHLVIAGIHTHTAPGNFYGNSLYDTFTVQSKRGGTNLAYVGWLVTRVAEGIRRAWDNKVPCKLEFAQTRIWGQTWNRSFEAFKRNRGSKPGSGHEAWWTDSTFPGYDAPEELSDENKAVDPRLRALVAFSGGEVFSVLGFFNTHPTALGYREKRYSADVSGMIVRYVEGILSESQDPPNSPVVGLVTSASGDSNTMYQGKKTRFGPKHAKRVALAISKSMGDMVKNLLGTGREFAAEGSRSWINLRDPARRMVNGDEDTRLAREWFFGMSLASGSEEVPVPFFKEGITQTEGHRAFPKDDPQYPKKPIGGILHGIAMTILGNGYYSLRPSPYLPLYLLKFRAVDGSWTDPKADEILIATVPAEPTAWAAHSIEKKLIENGKANDRQVVVMGYSGEYSGYLTTQKEFEAQHYEGSSTIYGKYTLNHMKEMLALADDGRPQPQDRWDEFEGLTQVRSKYSFHEVGPEPVNRKRKVKIGFRKKKVIIRWRGSKKFNPIIASGPLIRLEGKKNSNASEWIPITTDEDPMVALTKGRFLWITNKWKFKIQLDPGQRRDGYDCLRVVFRDDLDVNTIERCWDK